jgi:hypothetical protein
VPTYNMVCDECGFKALRRAAVPLGLLNDEQLKKIKHCPECDDYFMNRKATPPSTLIKETLDNGAMSKAVERIKDAEELYRERADNDPKLKR